MGTCYRQGFFVRVMLESCKRRGGFRARVQEMLAFLLLLRVICSLVNVYVFDFVFFVGIKRRQAYFLIAFDFA